MRLVNDRLKNNCHQSLFSQAPGAGFEFAGPCVHHRAAESVVHYGAAGVRRNAVVLPPRHAGKHPRHLHSS